MERYDALSTACDAVILANGQFPRHRVPTRVLEEAKLLVCCDGALATLHRERPELEARLLSEGRLLATGDGDSLSPALRERYGAIFRQVYEQDDNDLTKATRLVLSLVKSAGRQPVVAYLGATGLREDHTIGNVSLLRRYRADFAPRERRSQMALPPVPRVVGRHAQRMHRLRGALPCRRPIHRLPHLRGQELSGCPSHGHGGARTHIYYMYAELHEPSSGTSRCGHSRAAVTAFRTAFAAFRSAIAVFRAAIQAFRSAVQASRRAPLTGVTLQ